MKPIEQARADLDAATARGELEKRFNEFQAVIAMAAKLKKVMVKRGITRAKARCEQCEGHLHGVLAGRRQHLHMRCDGPCKAIFME